MPLIATKGAASAQGFGEFAQSAAPTYIEDVFSTYLYTGTGANQTFNNGVDLSTKGGMVWIKQRSSPAEDWRCVDSARGITNGLQQNLNNAQQDWTGLGYVTSFNTNGFSIGTNVSINTNNLNYASWTFREQPKFFDVVTYTGNGSATQTINHNLGSVPGCIIIKVTSQADDWYVYHRSLSQSSGVPYWLNLNTTAAETFFGGGIMLNATPTSTSFTVKGGVNGNGNTYVAYLFAHNAGGFGLSGSDNVISCGSYTGTGSGEGPQINLGYEPQWLLIKNVTGGASMAWWLFDSMRGMTVFGSNDADLRPNSAQAEENAASYVNPNATGFTTGGATALNQVQTYIYIAIRRGPMKTPTSGTSVFAPETATASTGTSRTIGFPADMSFGKARTITANNLINDRLRGYANSNTTAPSLFTNATSAESTATSANVYNVWNTTALDGAYFNGNSTIWYHFRRAPGFFDVVCYTGTGANRTVAHNLGVVPELMIVKGRSGPNGLYDWPVYNATLGATKYLWLNAVDAENTFTPMWNDTAPTASVFTVGTGTQTNQNTATYVAYLFASCPGVSKVGSYTGTGTTKQIDCGFTGGARWVMIKRTDSTGDWYVWDSARGIVAGNDPYLLLNSTAAEVTNTDYVDTYSAGFEISSTAPAAINANGGTFIFLAIA